jgi:hypothetical protein
MTKQQAQRPTAKIYVFPTRPHTASGNHHQAYAQQQTAQLPPIVCGGSWYHQAAIEEEADVVVRPLPYKQH